ncbi:hypothetical protein [Ralstonia pseudosolanacearum]
MKIWKSILSALFLSVGTISLTMTPSVITSAASIWEKAWMLAVLIGITVGSLILTQLLWKEKEVVGVEKKPFEVEAGVQVDVDEKNALALTDMFRKGDGR